MSPRLPLASPADRQAELAEIARERDRLYLRPPVSIERREEKAAHLDRWEADLLAQEEEGDTAWTL